MVLKSFAKINLDLLVNKKLPNGLHNIQSIFCLVNLFDVIHIKKLNKSKQDKICFVGPYSKLIKKKNNSIFKTLKILRKKKLIFNFYSIKVVKNIPVFAGLGGGTSNAATVMQYVLRKSIKKEIFDNIADYVSTDLRLFFYKQGYLTDIKTVIKWNKKYNLNFLIVYPRVKCSTKKIYSKVRTYTKKKIFLEKKLIDKRIFHKYIKNSKNDLQLIVEKNYPVISELLVNISKKKGCHFSRLTGSGSACFGVFVDKQCLRVALKELRKKYPKFWFSIAKTI